MEEIVNDGTGRGWWLGAGVLTGATLTVIVAMLAMSILFPAPAAAGPTPHFVEEAEAAGLVHTYDGEFAFFVGGGVAVFDCNDDGKQDLFIAGGTNEAALFVNGSPIGGKLRFEPLHASGTDLTQVAGAYPIDIDSDGLIDLAVLRVGENVVLRGLGDCRFERANEQWGIDGGDAWTAAFSATWEGDADLPSLVFGSYLALDESGGQTGTCGNHEFFRPSGSDGYTVPIELTPGWCSLSMLFSDWDRSGSADLRMANDRHYYRDGEEQLWHIVPGENPRPYSHAEGWQQMRIWGMGIASQDLDGDGLPEVFLTSQGDNKLQTLTAGADTPTYKDIALDSRATATRPFIGDVMMPSTAWHPEFEDVNNDGFMDLYISKGNVDAMAGYAVNDPNDLLLGEPDGTFSEAAATAGLINLARTRGAALADFNLDGMLDLVEVNRRENVTLWRNTGASSDGSAEMGGWIAVKLQQSGANHDAIGAWIEVAVDDRTIQREVTIGGGHAGGQLGWIHFGLGNANDARLRVQWPDGVIGPWLDIDAGRFATIERGADGPRLWEPSDF
jgi:enediyne biosynthesis protein E4